MKTNRTKTLVLAVYFSFFVVLGRLFYWQIIKSSELRIKVIQQTYKLEKNEPNRGKIYSSDRYPLAINQTDYQLSIYKPNIDGDLLTNLSKIEEVKPGFLAQNQSLINSFSLNPNQRWINLPTIFTLEEKEKISLSGIEFQSIQNRYYPEVSLARQILGVTNRSYQDKLAGFGGIEGYYNKQLTGKTGFSWVSKDATGQTILNKKGWQTESINGRDIYLNINRQVQYIVEKNLLDGVKKYSADSGSIIVLKPETGDVLAMASVAATSSATISATKNPAIADLYEPGSIFKPIVMSLALDRNVVDSNFICDKCDQPRVIGEYTINNWDFNTHPQSTLFDIIKNSDNIGMSYIIDRIGTDNFITDYKKLGLDQRTGIDLSGESRSKIKSYWAPIDLATASFGQGFAITQIQMVRAFNSLANDGWLVQPRVVDYMQEGEAKIKPKTKERLRIFKADTTKEIKTILKYSVENGAVAQFKPKGMEVCAKSGTAQIAVGGNYTDSATVGSYIGFSPCNQPKFTMIVTLNNPKTSAWGSSTAAPMWFEIANQIQFLL